MSINSRLLAELARRRAERAFAEGFYGEALTWFKRLGADGVRRLIQSRQLNCVEYSTAQLYLARHGHIEAKRAWATFAMTALGLIVAILALAVNFAK
jgi:hypothetical protein